MTISNLCFWSAKPFFPNQTKISSRVLKYKTEYKANLLWLEKEKPKGGGVCSVRVCVCVRASVRVAGTPGHLASLCCPQMAYVVTQIQG